MAKGEPTTISTGPEKPQVPGRKKPISDLVFFADSLYKGPTAVIATPSVRGNELTGWSASLKDKEVADLASARSSLGRCVLRCGSYAARGVPDDLATRPLMTSGRGAFDARSAQGRVGIWSQRDELPPRLTPASPTRALAPSGLFRSRSRELAYAPSSPAFGAITAPRRLARTTMRTTPWFHRDRPTRVPQFGVRDGSSSGKGVRAA